MEFLTSFYRYSLRHDLARNARHVLMFASGCLCRWPMAGADHLLRRLSCRGRMTLMFAGLPCEAFPAIALMSYGKAARSAGMIPERLVLITLAAALVMHRRRGTAANGQAARRITPHRIQSAEHSPAAPPASRPRRVSMLRANDVPSNSAGAARSRPSGSVPPGRPARRAPANHELARAIRSRRAGREVPATRAAGSVLGEDSLGRTSAIPGSRAHGDSRDRQGVISLAAGKK